MAFKKIEYKNLNPRQQEIYNFQKIASALADYGFNCMKLSDDWQGADFIAYHKDGNETLRIQLKGRINIAKKYLNKGLYVAFPSKDFWYLIEHDKLVEIVGKTTNWLNTPSWIKSGHYHSAGPGKELLEQLKDYRL
jgi:hypothetical protein